MIKVKPEHLTLNRAGLENAILNQASWYELYGTECSTQRIKLARLKNKLEYISAQEKIKIRAEAETAKIKMTQDQVDCVLITTPVIQELKLEILDTEQYLGQLEVAVMAMMHKRDSIQNELKFVTSRLSMISGDVCSDTKFETQTSAVEKSIAESMAK